VPGRLGHDPTDSSEPLRRPRSRIVADDIKARLSQVASHGEAHDSDADHANSTTHKIVSRRAAGASQ
jgi:hypothetical protein